MANPAAFWNGNKSLFGFCCFHVHLPSLLAIALESFVKVILTTCLHIAFPQAKRGSWVSKGLVLWNVLRSLERWATDQSCFLNSKVVPSWYCRNMSRELNQQSFNWPDLRLVQHQGTQAYSIARFQRPRKEQPCLVVYAPPIDMLYYSTELLTF